MHISDEWLALERDILGHRPLISGSVSEVRAAYQETSNGLAKLYPEASSYQVRDCRWLGNPLSLCPIVLTLRPEHQTKP